jgi:hypothetical protein
MATGRIILVRSMVVAGAGSECDQICVWPRLCVLRRYRFSAARSIGRPIGFLAGVRQSKDIPPNIKGIGMLGPRWSTSACRPTRILARRWHQAPPVSSTQRRPFRRHHQRTNDAQPAVAFKVIDTSRAEGYTATRQRRLGRAAGVGKFSVEFRFNTEREIKFTTDEAGLRRGISWLNSQIKTELGQAPTSRNHLYFDRPDFLLSTRGVSFRRTLKKPSYCLKYPIGEQGMFLMRREVFTKCRDFHLDVRNPLHQNAPVIRWMMAYLQEDKLPVARRLIGFCPQMRIECQRVWRIIPRPDDVNWMVGIALDRLKAFRLDEAEPFTSWCEIELEPSVVFADNLDVAQSLADGLIAEGLEVCTKSKYTYAADMLLQQRNPRAVA